MRLKLAHSHIFWEIRNDKTGFGKMIEKNKVSTTQFQATWFKSNNSHRNMVCRPEDKK